MKIVVNDANILFDLLDIDLIDEFCRLPCEMVITDAVLGEFDEDTLNGYHSAFDSGQILIHQLTSDQLKEVVDVGKPHSSALSFPDCSCLYLARKLFAILLTGDKPLRNAAITNKIQVHGSLWIMDQLVKEKIIDNKKAHAKMVLLMKINKRLPIHECEKRLKRWGKL